MVEPDPRAHERLFVQAAEQPRFQCVEVVAVLRVRERLLDDRELCIVEPLRLEHVMQDSSFFGARHRLGLGCRGWMRGGFNLRKEDGKSTAMAVLFC